MKKLLSVLAFLCACAPLYAQGPTCTSVIDTLYSVGVSAPVLMTGQIDLSLGYSQPDGAFIITQSAARQTIVAGALSTCLAPGSYQAQYTVRKPAPMTGTVLSTRFWVVPAGGGPYTVSSVETATPSTPALAVALSQLSNGGATNAQCLVWSAASLAWIPGACGARWANGVFTSTAGFTITHSLNTFTPHVSLWDSSGFLLGSTGSTVVTALRATSANTVAVTLSASATGTWSVVGPPGISGGLILSALTNGQLAALTNSQLTALAN
jgi:hypothetical protein